MRSIILLIIGIVPYFSNGQQLADLFQQSDTKITWLGIDFPHVKLIGDFNQFAEWGAEGAASIRDNYFPEWNELVYSEYKKYDVAGMLRKENMVLDTDYAYELNKKAPLEELEARQDPDYSKETIQSFVKPYSFKQKEGLGVLLVAESLNKYKEHAKYHFVVLDLHDNTILLHHLFIEKPGGFGLRNYWAKSFFNVVKNIKEKAYFDWKEEIIGKK